MGGLLGDGTVIAPSTGGITTTGTVAPGDADLEAMKLWKPATEANPAISGFDWNLGLTVPRSPVQVFASSMRHGMSGGFKFSGGHIKAFDGTVEQYADYIKSVGYDIIIDDVQPKTLDENDEFDRWIIAMTARGLLGGANPNIPGNLGIVSNPNLAFQSNFLPEWGKPAYRDAQLLSQRFGRHDGFIRLLIGADNAGYVPYWDWAATIPDRPWARAFLAFQNGHDFKVPVGPGNSPSKPYERRGTQREFVD